MAHIKMEQCDWHGQSSRRVNDRAMSRSVAQRFPMGTQKSLLLPAKRPN